MKKINLPRINLNKTQFWIAWGVGIAIILSVFVLTMKPRMKKYGSIKAEIAKEEQNIAMARDLISKKAEYEKAIQDINQRIKYYEGKLPQGKETDQLLEDLARIATDTKIKYQSIRPGPMTSLQSQNIDLPYYRWPIVMRLTCGYHELGLYINYLETATRFINIDSLTIDSGDDIFRHNVTLDLSTYVAGK